MIGASGSSEQRGFTSLKNPYVDAEHLSRVLQTGSGPHEVCALTQFDLGALSPGVAMTYLSREANAAESELSGLERLRLTSARFSCLVALECHDEAARLVSLECLDAEEELTTTSRWQTLYSGYMRACLLLFQSPLPAVLPWLLERSRHHAHTLMHVTLELRCDFALLCEAWTRRDAPRFETLLGLHQLCASAAGMPGLSESQCAKLFPWSEGDLECSPRLRPDVPSGQVLLVNFLGSPLEDPTQAARMQLISRAHRHRLTPAPAAAKAPAKISYSHDFWRYSRIIPP